jgi:hypothetical protein
MRESLARACTDSAATAQAATHHMPPCPPAPPQVAAKGLDGYQVQHLLGKGASGVSHTVRLQLSGGAPGPLACAKTITYGPGGTSLVEAFREVYATKTFGVSEHAARFVAVHHDRRAQCFRLITELCAGGSLQAFLVGAAPARGDS